jgi:AraC-like DNA-binding protein
MSDSVEISVPSVSHESSADAADSRTESIASVLLAQLSGAGPANIPTLEVLAESLNLSAGRLQHIIKQETGIPFTRHVKVLRLQRARKLLQETCWTVKQVMIEVGISDHSHFAKDYKKQFGETPTQTRCAALASRNKSSRCISQQNSCTASAKPIRQSDGADNGAVLATEMHEPVPHTNGANVSSQLMEESQP